MRISDELLELLGDYFIKHNIGGVTFEQFVETMVRNNWVHELKF